MAICCDKIIKIVQGDTFNATFTFKKNFQDLDVDNVWFTCDKLNLQKSLVQSNNHNWLLTLSSEDTKNLNPCKATYDITIDVNGEMKTVIYCAELLILKKYNEVNESD